MQEINVSDPIQFEKILLKFLFKKESLRNKVLPYLKVELFNDQSVKFIVKEIIQFSNDFGKFPSPRDLLLGSKDDRVKEKLTEISNIVLADLEEENLKKKVEKFFKIQMVFNELSKITIALEDGNLEEIDPQKIAEAKSFTFDDSVGMDILEDDGSKFFEYLHEQQHFIPTGLKKFDSMMCGGFKRKAMSLLICQTNGGKTLWKCALSKLILNQGYNVLFIPLEGTEEAIRDRLFFNLFDRTKKELEKLNFGELKEAFEKIKNSIKNRLILKGYSEHTLNANRLRLLLKDLKEKKGFVPDIIFVDYLGLVIPNSVAKDSGNQASLLKRASEEFHAVAKEFDVALVSSMQFNRGGFGNSDPGMEDTSESFATMFTADEVIILIQTEEMLKASQYIYKKAKTRTGNKGFIGSIYTTFEKQNLYELENGQLTDKQTKEQNDLIEKASSDIVNVLNKQEEGKLQKNFEFT